MKHSQLRSIAHNIADSLASGIGLPIGVWMTNIFGEARRSPEGFITVNFLNGEIVGGKASGSLSRAVRRYSEALPDLCQKQGATVSHFRKLTARYSADLHRRVLVTIEDQNGRRSTDAYLGNPLGRVKTVDKLGRVRTKRK
jgi:hypothetical protein